MCSGCEKTPLLAEARASRRRKFVHIGAGLAVFLVVLVVLAELQGRQGARSSSSSKKEARPKEEVVVVSRDRDAWVTWPPPEIVHESWRSGSGEAVRVEEHYVFSTGESDKGNSAHIFLKQAYTYWRYGLNGPRAMRSAGARAIEVESFRYNEKEALLKALAARELSAGAMVFVSVTTMALELEVRDFEALRDRGVAASQILQDSLELSPSVRRAAGDEDPSELKFESLCVYAHTPDLFLRSELLRELFAYPKPLVLVLAGDSACRLRLPETHHAVVLPNDGAPASGPGDVLWFPEGLEGLESHEDRDFWRTRAERNAIALTDAPRSEAPRPFLLDCAMSVNGRKPSRQALLDYLERRGGVDALRRLADDSGLALRLNATVIDEPLPDGSGYSSDYRAFHLAAGAPPADGGDDRAVFALAPAGDTWSSGRTLEAMLLGAVPVVDATYASDRGASAKGCGDAARFWRDGVPGRLRGAPFVFIHRWDDLPDALRAAGADDPDALRRRLDDVQAYRDELEAFLRTSLLDLVRHRQDHPAPRSTCRTAQLDQTLRDAQIDAEQAYYTSDWFHAFLDLPSFPTGACTTAFHTHADHVVGPPIIPRYGVPCFDPVCVPSFVRSFDCVMHAH